MLSPDRIVRESHKCAFSYISIARHGLSHTFELLWGAVFGDTVSHGGAYARITWFLDKQQCPIRPSGAGGNLTLDHTSDHVLLPGDTMRFAKLADFRGVIEEVLGLGQPGRKQGPQFNSS